MRHGHHHPHDHGHAHAAAGAGAGGGTQRALIVALALTAGFAVVEAIGGWMAGSLALLSDAGHMFSDVVGLGLSLAALAIASRPSDARRTYGWHRVEILAALGNGVTLVVLALAIIWEGWQRLRAPVEVHAALMLPIAAIGFIANIVGVWLLHGAHSLNVKGAYLHILGDLLGSVGTVVAAVVIRTTGWHVADPIASIIVSLLILRSAWALVRESVDVMLESTPSHISLGAVRAQLEAIPGIEAVHDLHVWTVTSGVIAMSAHAIVREPERHQHVLEHALDAMRLFGIQHVTVQIEQQEMYERELHLHA
jgi:cobalt-zinc-cadmium efflux system protein